MLMKAAGIEYEFVQTSDKAVSKFDAILKDR